MSFYNKIFTQTNSLEYIKNRAKTVLICFLLLYFILIAKLIIIYFFNNQININNIKNYNKRGKVLDCKNNIIVDNIQSISLHCNPKKIKNPEETSEKLSKILKINKEDLIKKFRTNRNFIWIKRNLDPKILDALYQEGVIGIEHTKHFKRIYLYNNIFSHIIGYVDQDMIGISGIEKIYNNYLKNPEKELTLTIDKDIQRIASNEMDNSIKKYNAKGGVAIIANPNNGDILGIISKPDFNPNNIEYNDSDIFFNKATMSLYELGSIYKAIIMAIAINESTTRINDVYNLDPFKINNLTIQDVHKQTGWHSLGEIFIKSSNVGTAQIAIELGDNKYKEYLKKLLLTKKLPIILQEKSKPIHPNINKKWNNMTLATMSYGYGSAITPLHFIQAMIPIVNGGILYPVRLIKSDKLFDQEETNRVFSKETSEIMKKLLRLTVKEGTAKKANLKGYLVGGKTGTAEKIIEGKYSKNKKRLSSFIGIMPSHNPEYLILVILDEPQGIKETYGFGYGAWNAAPTAKNILKKIALSKNINQYNENDIKIQNYFDINYKINNDGENYQRTDI